MKSNKGNYTESIIWLVFIVTSLVFKFNTVDNISLSTYLIFFIVLNIILWMSLYKHRYELLGIKYNFTFGGAVTLYIANLLVGIILHKNYPKVFEKYNTFAGIISIACFFILIGVIATGAKKMKNKQN